MQWPQTVTVTATQWPATGTCWPQPVAATATTAEPQWITFWGDSWEEVEEGHDLVAALLQRAREVYRAHLQTVKLRNAAPIDPTVLAPVVRASAPRRHALRASARGIRNWRRRAP